MNIELELTKVLPQERRERLNLSDEDIRNFYEAFKAIDENGDQRLQRSEIKEVLQQIGHEYDETTLNKLFDEASPKGKELGLDLLEFLELMSVEKSTREGSIGHVMRSKMQQVLTYSNLRIREMALRNKVVHKKVEVDEDSLDVFLKQGTRCAQCRMTFNPDENDDEACKYHPGPSSTHEAKENHLARVTFRCCGREQVGSNPALVKAPPCNTTRHRTREEVDALQSKGTGA
mmetsp:Transcript_13021/g.26017  ORF Transcript_13021/g.26017 Transcript_13021/m.26017 type:complete len:232 (-) Transcript_13021:226-921(-)|eukprot:CAMPEP_0181293018 /NCGR_PEP_ID=MMETSP1101-20121128/2831_1 /TAXON_ID=46948 /ORGANISM="Rhodomonas abbreviata, Strain Caron Lab Isolate" /LENGTH=231 /DNA_ID=CAMNT_0023397557 /DNA_START=51 /DNA_END=746 /DNA_ORIENTATION=+